MIPVIEHSSLLTLFYWLLMIPIAIPRRDRVAAVVAEPPAATEAGCLIGI